MKNNEITDEFQEQLHEKIEDTHHSEWSKFAGISSTISLLLPILSEFAGAIGENFIYAIGGTGAVSVFAVLMKLGRVACVIPEIEAEHHEHLNEEANTNRERIVKQRQRRKDSDYIPDF